MQLSSHHKSGLPKFVPYFHNSDLPVLQKKSRRNSSARETFKVEPADSPQLSYSHLNPLNQNWKRDENFSHVYQTPSAKRTRSEYPEPDTPHHPAVQKDEPVEIVKEAGSRTPTLKGIVFTGMGIFDAGTPEMKRMRNQKKDPSVVENMMLVSKSISKTETVWGRSMQSVERTRSVYDSPTDPSDELVSFFVVRGFWDGILCTDL